MNKGAACAVDCSDWRFSSSVSLAGSSCPDGMEEMKRREVPFHLTKYSFVITFLSQVFKDNWSEEEREVISPGA